MLRLNIQADNQNRKYITKENSAELYKINLNARLTKVRQYKWVAAVQFFLLMAEIYLEGILC